MIRAATPADLAQLAALITGLAAHHDDAARVTEASLARDLFGPSPWFQCLVAGETDLLGYTALTQLARLQWGQRGLDIHHLFVTPPHRAQGIGTALVGAAISLARAQSCDYLTVTALASNRPAQGFYTSLGFHAAPHQGLRFGLDLRPADAR